MPRRWSCARSTPSVISEIARHCQVSQSFVTRLRRRLSDAGHMMRQPELLDDSAIADGDLAGSLSGTGTDGFHRLDDIVAPVAERFPRLVFRADAQLQKVLRSLGTRVGEQFHLNPPGLTSSGASRR